MSPAELCWRVQEQAARRAWSPRQVRPGSIPPGSGLPAGDREFTAVLPTGSASLVPEQAAGAIVAAADRLRKGEWEMLGVIRADMDRPDWFFDPVTRRRSDPGMYAFRINQRDEEKVGNIKQVWELNRLQHLTLLAAAWHLTHQEAYARLAADQLRSWWEQNPFLSGVNWTSGIELGIRLINLVWIRRLLDDWPEVADLFEHDDLALRQIRWHQQYLATFVSRGSSANNHVVAEAAGQLAASCAFPWFPESGRWRRGSAQLLERELERNTFPSGINRELATDYHGFVAELGFFAAVEAAAAGFPVSDDTWRLLCAMTDCMAALVDERGQPPRQGDSDEGRVVLLDAPEPNRWLSLLAIGETLFGRLDWWPDTVAGSGSALAGALAGAAVPREVPGRPPHRPSRFADAGITILRTDRAGSPGPGSAQDGGTRNEASLPEIWCRCDGGPHGFLSIAAHAHADALSIEVRYGGVDILADPGTYCYHGEPAWRSYFRSTIAHNTVEIGGRSQTLEGGPFLWLRAARSRDLTALEPGLHWTAEHDGYTTLSPKAWHRRSVRLHPQARGIDITDVIDGGGHEVRLAFHLGPLVRASLDGSGANLTWPDAPVPGHARLDLSAGLEWRLHRGETSPVLGWYSAGLGRKEPATTIVGTGRCERDQLLITRLQFVEAEA
jgi:Heparinase II/III-like protein/Heparinase II/III N-terminus